MGTRVGQQGGMAWHPALYCLICTYRKKSVSIFHFKGIFLKQMHPWSLNSLKEFQKFSIDNIIKYITDLLPQVLSIL